jgi:acylphosphatase
VVSKVTEMTGVRLTAWVEGRVQGVGFRWWVRSRALELGLVGFAENLADGRVKVVAEGASSRCRELLALLADGTVSGDVTPGGASAASRDSVTGGDSVAGGDSLAGGNGTGGRGAASGGGVGGVGDLAADTGLVWPSRSRRPGQVTKVAYRWAEAVGEMSSFTER